MHPDSLVLIGKVRVILRDVEGHATAMIGGRSFLLGAASIMADRRRLVVAIRNRCDDVLNMALTCSHPSGMLSSEEPATSCRGKPYTREHWDCPDCGASWTEAAGLD